MQFYKIGMIEIILPKHMIWSVHTRLLIFDM